MRRTFCMIPVLLLSVSCFVSPAAASGRVGVGRPAIAGAPHVWRGGGYRGAGQGAFAARSRLRFHHYGHRFGVGRPGGYGFPIGLEPWPLFPGPDVNRVQQGAILEREPTLPNFGDIAVPTVAGIRPAPVSRPAIYVIHAPSRARHAGWAAPTGEGDPLGPRIIHVSVPRGR